MLIIERATWRMTNEAFLVIMKRSKRILSNKSYPRMSTSKRVLLPLAAGLAGALLLTGLYFGIVSWAESPQHAAEFFWEDRRIVFPIIIGFGVQAGLYTILKLRLFIPITAIGLGGPMMGVGGTTSTIAMVACCAHHVADVLPILGLIAAASFLTQYRIAFMFVGLGTTVLGILIMLYILFKERRRAIQLMAAAASPVLETL
jgi:hypothetical protein